MHSIIYTCVRRGTESRLVNITLRPQSSTVLIYRLFFSLVTSIAAWIDSIHPASERQVRLCALPRLACNVLLEITEQRHCTGGSKGYVKCETPVALPPSHPLLGSTPRICYSFEQLGEKGYTQSSMEQNFWIRVLASLVCSSRGTTINLTTHFD